jgi:hypothetical protein
MQQRVIYCGTIGKISVAAMQTMQGQGWRSISQGAVQRVQNVDFPRYGQARQQAEPVFVTAQGKTRGVVCMLVRQRRV